MSVFRIPSRVPFPFGYIVCVQQVPAKSEELYDEEDDSYSDGLWDVNMRTIYLNKAAAITRKRWVFVHELEHAWADWKEHYVFMGNKVRP